jgi:DNA adenine methylase
MSFISPITYYGGKKRLLPHLLPLIPPHDLYTECFAGGLALYFALPKAKNSIINDTNAHVTNFYVVLKSDFYRLKAKIEATPYSRISWKVAMTMYESPHLFDPLQRAWSFYVLTNMGFSGKMGSFGCYSKGTKAYNWEKKKQLFVPELSAHFSHTQIECTDALKILSLRNTATAFHFIDPPYFNSNCGHYKGYSEKDFRKLLETLTKIKGKFLMTSYPSELLSHYTEKYGWYSYTITQKISASRTTKQKEKTEVITTNYPVQSQTTQKDIKSDIE